MAIDDLRIAATLASISIPNHNSGVVDFDDEVCEVMRIYDILHCKFKGEALYGVRRGLARGKTWNQFAKLVRYFQEWGYDPNVYMLAQFQMTVNFPRPYVNAMTGELARSKYNRFIQRYGHESQAKTAAETIEEVEGEYDALLDQNHYAYKLLKDSGAVIKTWEDRVAAAGFVDPLYIVLFKCVRAAVRNGSAVPQEIQSAYDLVYSPQGISIRRWARRNLRSRQ